MPTVVLVNPPYSFWSPEKNFLRPFIGTLPSLGLLSLAGLLGQHGYRVKIVESASLGFSLSQTLENILKENPDYVGRSCTASSVDNAGRIPRAIKQSRPQVLTFVGGPHITALPEETLRRYPSFDPEPSLEKPGKLHTLGGRAFPLDREEFGVVRAEIQTLNSQPRTLNSELFPRALRPGRKELAQMGVQYRAWTTSF